LDDEKGKEVRRGWQFVTAAIMSGQTLVPAMQPRLLFDVLAVIVGLLYSLLMTSHGTLFGVALLV
jgi:hypothetical protein